MLNNYYRPSEQGIEEHSLSNCNIAHPTEIEPEALRKRRAECADEIIIHKKIINNE
jgi:hypothetical protein